MDCLEVLFSHQTLRRYTDTPLTDAQVLNIKRAVLQTSSACFYQVCRVIRVTDRELLTKLGELSGGTMKLAQAPEFWMFCLDFTLLRRIAPLPEAIPFNLFFHAVNDCSMACQSALTAAEAQGLGCVAIGGFKRRIKAITEILKLPKYTAPVLGLVIGVPDEEYREEQKPRLPQDWIFMDNCYADKFEESEFAAYNERYRTYAANRKYNREAKTWSEACAAMLNKDDPTADPLVQYYEQQGISFK